MIKSSSTTSKTARLPELKHNSRELFERATERLSKLLSFDVAALFIARPVPLRKSLKTGRDRSRAAGKTELWVRHSPNGKEIYTHKILNEPLEGEFHLVGGQLIVVSRSEIARGVSFIKRVAGIDTRALKSGLLLPLPGGRGTNVVLFLGSFNNRLLRARKKLSLAEIHAALSANGAKIDKRKTTTPAAYASTGGDENVDYRKIFEGIDLPAAVLEDDLTILQVNSAFEKTFGYANQHLARQRSLRDFVSSSERRRLFRQRDNRSRQRFEALLVLHSGAEKSFEVTLHRLEHPDLRIATFHDVSAIRESALELRERAERLSFIQSVGEAVNAAVSVEEIFVRLVKNLRHISQFEYAGLAFHNPASDQIRLEAVFKHGHFSVSKAELPRKSFERLTGATAGIRVKLPDDLLFFLGVEKHESVVAVVLSGKIQGAGQRVRPRRPVEPLGCLVLASEYPNAFSQFHIDVLESVGDLLSAGIRKVQLLQEAHENYDRLSLLSEASRAIGYSLDIDQVLKDVVNAAKKTLNATTAAVCLVNEQGNGGRAVAGMSEEEWQWPICDVTGILAKAGPDEVISIADVRRSALFTKECKDYLHEKGLHAFLGAAIFIDNKPAAVLGVFAEEDAKFRRGGASIISALAAQTARVLHNARLFQQVNETKNYLENLLKSSADAIVTADRRGRVIYFSPGAEQMLGWAAKDALSRPMMRFLYHGKKEAKSLLGELLRSKKIQSYECDILHADGGRVPASLSLSQILNDGGALTGFLAIGKDISARKAAEQESIRRGEELENYTYLISHNLKTPIVSIQGFVNLLLDEMGPSLNQQHAHFLERIQKNAAMMEKMIVDLFDFSRMARPQLNLGVTRTQEIVQSVVDEMKVFDSMRDVVFEIAQDLPEIIADAEGIQIVFDNLIGNAAKYRRPGGPAKITVGWQSQPRFFAFHVQDNGIGFDPAFKERAFALFQRGPNTGLIPGTGVGLALVKRIIENHQGLVRIESTPQTGTTVHFTIPKGLGREG